MRVLAQFADVTLNLVAARHARQFFHAFDVSMRFFGKVVQQVRDLL